MTTLLEAAQQALEALEAFLSDELRPYEAAKTSDALRAALAEPACCCGEPTAAGVVHRQDGPCYMTEPVQEPVAWMCPEDPERETAFNWKAGHCENCGKQRIPLYTTPPQRKPLTEEEIDELSRTMVKGDRPVNWLCRAIERAHGIGEK